jgi:hypothetical protein
MKRCTDRQTDKEIHRLINICTDRQVKRCTDRQVKELINRQTNKEMQTYRKMTE